MPFYFQSQDILLKIGGLSVRSWGLMVVIAFLVALFLVIKEAKKRDKVLVKHIYNLGFIVIISAVIGSRLLYVLYNLNLYIDKPFEIFAVWNGGMVSYGGLIFAFLFGWLYIKKKRFNFFEIADLVVPYAALGLAIGRIGCFLAGHCFGLPTTLPWGVIFVNNIYGAPFSPVHPTQLYHLVANLVIFFILLNLSKVKERLNKITNNTWFSKKGSIFFLFLLFYGVQRLFIDFLRNYRLTSLKIIGLTPSQLIALGMILVAVIIIILLKLKK